MAIWTVHGDGVRIGPGEVVGPGERLSWPRTIGIGSQHVVAMFGATFLVPLITGFPPSTTLFFSAVGTVLFLLITRNRVPSYLGSSFAFIAPIGAATEVGGMPAALGGILVVGVLLALIGLLVHFAGARWIDVVMPPIVTGTVVALIGFNLAPSAWNNVKKAPATALATIAVVVLVTVLFRGILGRLAILVGVLAGYVVAVLRDEVDFTRVGEADWLGLPTFTAPSFDLSLMGLFVPVVIVLVAENIGHVKSVAAMTGENLDDVTGRALLADGLATTLAGAGGGSGTTTYAENIGVMAATRVYSTAAYGVAALVALLLSMSPKFGELINTVPAGVLGGAATVLYGMIGVLGARIWVQAKVDFSDPVNLTTAAIALIVGIANYTWVAGDLRFEGIALGTAAALGVYHLMRALARWRGTTAEPASPASVPDASRED
ncbi:NCS2 family nucleobase:cation symporter [Georgenia satyanarayanai]|uniref:uracil-xanthine permease family protein n=1 Tax=Georgenia satyanarayanai TaxID=860221 RepID=UPI00203D28B0|nr:solute carrier family 23 protein [Georgenia satyanarayanai]MCM3661299.1 NCS2 family nucleobase:cation symporter [Georgenia satyanarayanai]